MRAEILTGFIVIVEISAAIVITRLPPTICLTALGGMSVINMLLITIAGARLTLLFGFVTNVGNVLYAAVLMSQAMIIERFGGRAALMPVGMIFGSLVMVLIIGQSIKHMPAVTGNEMVAAAVNAVFALSARVVWASFVAFGIVNALFVAIYGALADKPVALRYAAVAALMQALDSVIFYGISFWGLVPPGELATAMLTGFAIKAAFALLTVPVIALVARDTRHPCVACPLIH